MIAFGVDLTGNEITHLQHNHNVRKLEIILEPNSVWAAVLGVLELQN